MNRKVVFAFVVLLVTSFSLTAVPLPAPGSGNASPIDAGIILLTVAGAAIGGRKLLVRK